jgi:transposase InsO family protein
MTTNDKLIKNKLGLIELAKHLGNVSDACKVMGYSRDTFYRWKDAYQEGGEEALQELTRRKANRKNRIPEIIEKAVLDYSEKYPAHGQVRVSNELRKEGISVSPGGVRCVLFRHNLHNFKLRLKALEQRVAETGLVLTEPQLQALEKAKAEKQAHGEIETEHPGYLGSQDTYQQTYVDTYSKVAHCKLYNMKSALTAADLLNDRVLPFYEAMEMPVLRILTDRGTEYCGQLDKHEYQLFLGLSDIDHTKTKAQSPQTNRICERFHKTILDEFYKIAFRKKIYSSIDELQLDLDCWLNEYNQERSIAVAERLCRHCLMRDTSLSKKCSRRNRTEIAGFCYMTVRSSRDHYI